MNSIKKYDADVPSEAEVGADMTSSVMDTSKDTMAELFQVILASHWSIL